jgi:hypothetical protein
MPNPFSGDTAVAESTERQPLDGREIPVGKQSVRFEPEIVYFRLRGTYEAHEVRGLTSLIDQVAEERGASYILVDMRELGWVSTEARRESAEWVRRSPIGALAIFGTNSTVRVIISLFLRAASLLGRSPYPMQFLDTEEEARAWLAAERSKAK